MNAHAGVACGHATMHTWPSTSPCRQPVDVCLPACRCVLATKDIAKDEVVVELPDDAVLMVENSSLAEIRPGVCGVQP